MVAHPPCTYLANSGVRWLRGDHERWEMMLEAATFFRQLLEAPIPCIAIENPIMHGYALSYVGRRPTQKIQPWQFGEPESKATCLWLKNLPRLTATNVLPTPDLGYWKNQTASGQNRLSPSPHRAADRARTYAGIAAAMAAQWETR